MSDKPRSKYQAFISHSSRDKEWADAVCAALERNRIRCWIAPRDIAPGTEWGAAIIDGIDACKVMVLVFSTHANESRQVRREVERAINKGLAVLPFRIEDVPPAGAMELALSNTHWLDAFTPPPEPKLEKLADSVKALLDGKVPRPIADKRPANAPAGSRRMPFLILGAIVAVFGVLLLSVIALLGWYGIAQTPNKDPDKKGLPNPEVVVVRLIGIAKPADAKITFVLDNQPMTFDALGEELTLVVGPHELVILKDGVEIERRDFAVVRANDQKKLVVPETLLKPRKITQLSAHTGEVTSVAFSGDGLRLISVGPVAADGAFIWDVPTGKQVHHYIRGKKTLKGATWSGALSFDGHAALIGGTHANKAGVLKPWLTAIGLESGTRLWESGDHTRRINSVAFSADGKFALSADEAGFTKIWNAGKEERLFQLAGSVACFGPSSRHVVTAVKSEAHLWELSNPPKELKVFKGHSDLIRSIAFAADGQHILTGGDATLRLWNIAADKEVQIFKGHDKEVTSVAISPDGRYALSGSKDKTVRLWNVSDGSEVLRFTEHTDVVNSVAYSPGGRRVASGSNDRTVRLWAVPK